MKRISWEHIFPGRRHPTLLALYVCPDEYPWYIDGILDVRPTAYRLDGPTLDRAVDEDFRGLVIDDVQESVEQNAESAEHRAGEDGWTFERFCEEFGCTPMAVYHAPYTLKADGKRYDIQVAVYPDDRCPDADAATVRELALEHLGLTADQAVFGEVHPADDTVPNRPVVVAPEKNG